MAEKKLTYRAKNESVCPVCECRFKREELLSGGGRMNAGELTDELHRNYLPTRQYGEVYPLLYPVTVCPQCWYAAYPRHFDDLEFECTEKIKGEIGPRKNALNPLFPDVDFYKDRELPEGIGSYILAVMCYEHRSRDLAPTFLRGLSSLRAAWLCADLHNFKPQENYDYLARILYRKAAYFYGETVRAEQSGEESVEDVPHHGPDVDNNYGFDGVLYLSGVLYFKHGPRSDAASRMATLRSARSSVARIVGMGKSSKSKPSAILDLGREIHKRIKIEMESLGGES